MRKTGIRGCQPPKKRYNSFKGGDPTGTNILDRRFSPKEPGQVLVTDITMFALKNTKVYV